MPIFWLFLIVLAIATVGYVLGRRRALQRAGGDSRVLHSLPSYYGFNVALKAAIPAFALLVIWLLAQPLYVSSVVSAMIPDTAIPDNASRGLVMAEVRRVADGLDNAVGAGSMTRRLADDPNADLADIATGLKGAGQIVTSEITQPILRGAQRFRIMNSTGYAIMSVLAIVLALAGAVWGYRNRSLRSAPATSWSRAFACCLSARRRSRS